MERMGLKRRTLIVGILAAAGLLRAGDFGSSSYAGGAAAYLGLPLHATSAGVSNAVTAWCQNIAGSQFNPAIIEATRSLTVIGSNTFWPDERQLYGGEASTTFGEYLVINAGFMHAGVDAIERRNDYGTLEGYFSDVENSVTLAAAGRLQGNVAWGLRGRYLNQRLDNEEAGGMGFDAGATWQPDSALCVGLSVLNIGSRLFWSTDQIDKVLMQGRLGVAGRLLDRKLTVAADLAKAVTQPVDFALGVQYEPLEMLALRGGVGTSFNYHRRTFRQPQFSLGAGMRHTIFGFDYSISIPLEKIGVVHRLSITFESATPLL
jgi:long-subunit fatty acid transport protein